MLLHVGSVSSTSPRLSLSLPLSFFPSMSDTPSISHRHPTPATLSHTFFSPPLLLSSSAPRLSSSLSPLSSRSLRHLHLSQPAIRVRQTPFDVIVVHRQPHHIRQVAKRRREGAVKAVIRQVHRSHLSHSNTPCLRNTSREPRIIRKDQLLEVWEGALRAERGQSQYSETFTLNFTLNLD